MHFTVQLSMLLPDTISCDLQQDAGRDEAFNCKTQLGVDVTVPGWLHVMEYLGFRCSHALSNDPDLNAGFV